MKSIIVFTLALIFSILESSGQDRFFTKSGQIEFFSHTPIEDIKALNQQLTSIIDFKTGEIVFSVLIKSFEFDKKLMQEHFNENYLESDKFPKSKFIGKIHDVHHLVWNENGSTTVMIKGDLEIHGVTKTIEVEGTLKKTDIRIEANSEFDIKPADFGIKIPSVVRDKIADSVKLSITVSYQPYK